MGFFSSSNFKPDVSDKVLIAKARAVKKNISKIKEGTPAEQLAKLRQEEKIERFTRGKIGQTIKGSERVGEQVGRAALIAQQQRVSFSREQERLQQMFGHGDKIWGTNNQPVSINNDLNSSRSDPFDETAGMFGFGPHGERSGMF